jgi:hypothetical protein
MTEETNRTGRVTRLEVENFKRIVGFSVDLAPGVTEISGRNAQGKTSFLDSINVLIDGMKAAPAEPIHQGAERARITGRLGQMEVIRYIDRKRGGGYTTKLMFKPVEDGAKPYAATQKQLDDLIGEHHLDPLDFLALDKKGKFDALRIFVPGFDFVKAAREHEADYNRRTDVNRLAKEARAAAGLSGEPTAASAEKLAISLSAPETLSDIGCQEASIHSRETYIPCGARGRSGLARPG